MHSNNILRYVFIALIVVPCFIVAGMAIVRKNYDIPWNAVVFYGLGLLAIRLLFVSSAPEEAPEGDNKVYLSARKQLVDWIKVQGLVVTAFLGIVGFAVMKEAVRDVVRDNVAPHVEKQVEEELSDATTEFDERMKKEISDASTKFDTRMTGVIIQAKKEIDQAKNKMNDELEATRKQAATLADQAQKAHAQAEQAGMKAEEAGARAKSLAEQAKQDVSKARETLEQAKQNLSSTETTLTQFKKRSDKFVVDANNKLFAYEKRADDAIKQNNIEWNEKLSEAEQELNRKILQAEERTRRFLLIAAEGVYGKEDTPDLLNLLDEQSKSRRATSEHIEAIITLLERRIIEGKETYTQEDKEKYTDCLIAAIDSQHKHVRNLAVRTLGRVGGQKATDKLMNILHDSDPDIRQEAASILTQEAAYVFMIEQETADEIVKALSAALTDSRLQKREIFAHALGNLGPSAKAAIPSLVKAMESYERQLRQSAAIALADIGGAPVIVVPKLLEFLRSTQQSEDRTALARALGNFGPDAKSAVKDLVDTLKAGGLGSNERREFMNALGDIGDPAAAPVLTDALEDKDPRIRDIALSALESLDINKTVLADILAQQLQKTLSSREFHRIAESLSNLGTSAKDVVPDLVKLFNNPNIAGDWRSQIAAALGRIATPEAHTALVDAFDDSDSEIVLAALKALSVAGYQTDEVVSRSIELLQDTNFDDKSEVAEILGSIGSAAKPAIPELLTLVSESSDAYAAVEALGCIGDTSVVEDLLVILESLPDEDDKYPILEALARIDDDKAAKAVVNSIGDRYFDENFYFFGTYVEEGMLSPALIKEMLAILDDDSISTYVRTGFAYMLAELEVDVSTVSARLIQIVESNEKDYFRASIAYLLSKSGIDDVVQDTIDLYQKVIERLLNEFETEDGYDYEIRATLEFICRTFYEYGPQASDVGPLLISALRNEKIDSDFHGLFIAILGWIRYMEALEFLDEMIRGSEGEGHEETILIAMWMIQGRTVDELVQDLNNEKYYFIHAYAAEELGKLGKEASSAVPHLVNALENDDSEIRVKAAIALRKIGIPSQEVIEALEQASRYDEDEDVQRAALRALEKLRNKAPD